MGKTLWLVNNTRRELINVSHDVLFICSKLLNFGWRDIDYIFLGSDNDMDSVDDGKMWKYTCLRWNEKNKSFDEDNCRSDSESGSETNESDTDESDDDEESSSDHSEKDEDKKSKSKKQPKKRKSESKTTGSTSGNNLKRKENLKEEKNVKSETNTNTKTKKIVKKPQPKKIKK
jgi:hypothetical protein